MTTLPLTHFTLKDAGIRAEDARRLGYLVDARGQALEGADQVIELRAQDLLVSVSCAESLGRVAGFVDDLLEKVYGLPRFYEASGPADLLGELVLTLAPHTSGGGPPPLVGLPPAPGGL